MSKTKINNPKAISVLLRLKEILGKRRYEQAAATLHEIPSRQGSFNF